ncbi:DnaB-like helicase N-terminal domain-containing protein [Streptomyces lydicamycinicus]|uniref:DnaB-like helicase N-terminal domain-containing protein n=1 Tax=Streptomyces lydicamycinicus TaxID=1546107 RepID=UPI0007C69994|nr:DnaB-like helicase N-terminal domain-containing protein [Streptomyces lydicamycinicus]
MPDPTASYEGDDLDDLPPPQPVHYAEQALLGALLLEPHRLDTIGHLEPHHFGNHAHNALFTAIRTVSSPDPKQHVKDTAWLGAVLAKARHEAPGLTASYLHTLIQSCPRPQHATAYAGMIRADHARRTLREHADRLCQTATDTTLPSPATTVLAQADALSRYLDELTTHFAAHPGSLPRTPASPPPPRQTGEEALDEEHLLLATATAHPDDLHLMRWLQPEDFALPLHGQLYRCLTALARRGDAVDPVTVLWEAQHQQLLTAQVTPADLMALVSDPVGLPDYWGERILRRALLGQAHAVGLRLGVLTDDQANTIHQLITGSRRALAGLSAVRSRWQHATSPTPESQPSRTKSSAAPRAGPPRTTAPPPPTARLTRLTANPPVAGPLGPATGRKSTSW